ncbi:hypothetical protein A0O34_17695 [Chryseobacterium glaciei]|uniref:Cyclic nucleotide-binding domain-containing protein n=1 Tax=Chryseobacterium glaciei TaxID=1685010 RepID=A0A172XYZ2_9FLAO|nr:Crp/Fnr family transcriptional regulator [Chryseobacterium glaciei]ANF52239.1 hypothetical protein A0O34_17695 [Chryseobacterium glaciei]
MNPLINKFKEYGEIPIDIEQQLLIVTKRQTKQKGDFFIKQGQSISSLFLIETGLVRSFFIKDDREINSWFGFEDSIMGAAMPLFYNEPSFENIQFLENSTYYYISSKDLNDLYKKSHEMSTIGRKIAEECCVIVAERAMSLQTESAEQRYNSLKIYKPDAIQRISLGHIASYLGVKAETLSRIRKK